jgi:multidrug efflux pump
MVQLVTRGILLDTMRVPTSDEEIDIRVRFPENARVLSTLDSLQVRTQDGLVPLSNFVSYRPAPQLAEISRVDQSRIFDVKADVIAGLSLVTDPDGATLAYLRDTSADATGGAADFTIADTGWRVFALSDGQSTAAIESGLRAGDLTLVPVNATERIAAIANWITTENPFPASVSWTWAGDQEDQAESQAFLGQAFGAALGLMFIILLAQFNSVYNAVLVLLAVILSTTGVLIGMLVMDQTFSIIMTGTGIVALAGIVVNNNIVLIDTYQEYARYMPRLDAITRTVEARIRPVLLTTITTMAGLAPMMYGISLDFANGGYSIDSPTALWWKQLATAVVFGLGIATVLTLVFTPALLAFRIWFWTILRWMARGVARMGAHGLGQRAQDYALQRQARHALNPTIFWDEDPRPDSGMASGQDPDRQPSQDEATDRQTDSDLEVTGPTPPLRAAE